jgi:hypothetical protein
MAQNRSEASRYKSNYGGDYVSPAQFIAEVMCERLAKKEKTSLPMQFWNTPKWKRTFMMQILAANGILKLYSPKAILSALRKAYNVYSLRAGWLQPLIQEEQAKIDNEASKINDEPLTPSPAQINTTEKPRESFTNQKSKLSKLRGLDG